MSPQIQALHERARAMMETARASADPTNAPNPEALEQAALGSALMALMSCAEENCPSADHLDAILGAVVTVAVNEVKTPRALIDHLARRVRRLWPTAMHMKAAAARRA